MSSETSIEVPPLAGAKDDGFRPWHFFVLVSILLATVAVIMARQAAPEHLVLLSFTIAAAGAAAGAFYRMLAPLAAPVLLRAEHVSERTREALEREKMLVLRTINELEFDRAMGKLSQKDFDEMGGRLRARALSLMKQIEIGRVGYTAEIERELAARSLVAPAPAVAAGQCACGTTNDADAVFCKKCGTRLLS